MKLLLICEPVYSSGNNDGSIQRAQAMTQFYFDLPDDFEVTKRYYI